MIFHISWNSVKWDLMGRSNIALSIMKSQPVDDFLINVYDQSLNQ